MEKSQWMRHKIFSKLFCLDNTTNKLYNFCALEYNMKVLTTCSLYKEGF